MPFRKESMPASSVSSKLLSFLRKHSEHMLLDPRAIVTWQIIRAVH